MTRFPILPLLLSITLLAGACDKLREGQFELDKHFQLSHGATADCTCGTLSLTFLNVVEDSRCPSDVECIWAGRVVIELKVELEGNAEVVRLSSINTESQATVGNFRITMGDVSPYPVSTATIPTHEYKVDLVVTEL